MVAVHNYSLRFIDIHFLKMSEAPSQLLNDSTQLQKFAGISAVVFAGAAMIMTAYWAHGPNTSEGYLGGLNWKEKTSNWHPVLMVAGAIFCLITSLLSFRVLPLPKTLQKTLHGIMHTAAFICMTIGLVAILQSRNFKKQNSHDAYKSNFTNIHAFVGLGVYILYGLNYLLGIAHYALPIFSLAMKKAFMHSHVFIGTFLLFGSLAAVVSGFTVMTGSCSYTVTSADTNPAEHYHLLTNGCQLANSIGIISVLAVLLCYFAIFRSGSASPARPDDKYDFLLPYHTFLLT